MWVIAIILLRNHKSRAVIKSPQGSLTHFTLLPVLLLALITLYRFQKSVRFGILRACEIPRSVSKTVNNFFHYGLHLQPKKKQHVQQR